MWVIVWRQGLGVADCEGEWTYAPECVCMGMNVSKHWHHWESEKRGAKIKHLGIRGQHKAGI